MRSLLATLFNSLTSFSFLLHAWIHPNKTHANHKFPVEIYSFCEKNGIPVELSHATRPFLINKGIPVFATEHITSRALFTWRFNGRLTAIVTDSCSTRNQISISCVWTGKVAVVLRDMPRWVPTGFSLHWFVAGWASFFDVSFPSPLSSDLVFGPPFSEKETRSSNFTRATIIGQRSTSISSNSSMMCFKILMFASPLQCTTKTFSTRLFATIPKNILFPLRPWKFQEKLLFSKTILQSINLK